MEANNNEKAMQGIRTFLERRGMNILETGWAHGKNKIDYIAEDDDELVFIACRIQPNEGKGMADEPADRKKFEKIAAAYLTEHMDRAEGLVRFDIVTMLVLGDHKALLRHHRNALSVADSDLG